MNIFGRLKLFLLLSLIAGGAMLPAAVFASEAEGDRYMELRKFHKAVYEYDAALKADPGREELPAKLGRALDADGWFGRSAETWEEYLAKFPDGESADEAHRQAAKARRWLGAYAYYSGESLELVIPQLEKALAHDPDLFEANYWLGRALLEKGGCEEASRYIKKAVAARPADRSSKWLATVAKGCAKHGVAAYDSYVRGWQSYEKGDLDRALTYYQAAVKENPNFALAHYWMARINTERGNYKEAVASWEKVLKIDPANSNAKWFLEMCRGKMAEKP